MFKCKKGVYTEKRTLPIFAAIVIIGIIIWQLLPKTKTISIPTDKPSLAVMYFENNTGDLNLDHYRKAISDLLITDLGQSKHLRILSGAQLFNILSQLDQLEARSYSSEILKGVAAKGGVRHILMGSYIKAGEMFRINYSLLEADTAEQVGSDVVEGRGEESVFAMVDELTKKIKTNFKLSNEEIASDFDMNVGEITTSSTEALKYYTEGAEYDHRQKYGESIELMKKAVEIDPNFAMAYRSMGITYQDMGYHSKAEESLRRALELSDKVSVRERLQIQGDYYWQSYKTYDKSIEAYSKLLELYPEDSNANINLGAVYSEIEEWDKARERFEILRKNKDESIFAYMQLSLNSSAKGDFDEAREFLEYYRDNISDNSSIHFQLHRLCRQQGKFDQALLELNKGDALDPHPSFILSRATIYYLKEELDAAEKELQKLLEAKDRLYHVSYRWSLTDLYLMQGKYREAKNQARPAIDLLEELDEKFWISSWHGYLAYLLYRTANYEEALKECDMMWKVAQDEEDFGDQVVALHTKGLIFAAMKSHDEAIKTADELKVMIDQWLNKKLIRWYYHLMGRIELAQENYGAAIDYFQRAIALIPFGPFNKDALFVESLASAYYKSGDLEKALQEYNRITTLTTGRLYYGDIYAKSFYMLGKIYEQQGDTAKAMEHYERFLDLWKNADPGIAEVDDAKERLAGLKNY